VNSKFNFKVDMGQRHSLAQGSPLKLLTSIRHGLHELTNTLLSPFKSPASKPSSPCEVGGHEDWQRMADVFCPVPWSLKQSPDVAMHNTSMDSALCGDGRSIEAAQSVNQTDDNDMFQVDTSDALSSHLQVILAVNLILIQRTSLMVTKFRAS